LKKYQFGAPGQNRGTAPGPVLGAQRRKKNVRKTWIRAKP